MLALLVATLAVVPLHAEAEGQASQGSKPATLVNLNTATAPQLETLPGIGPKTAAAIIEYRQKNGGFKKIEELMNIKGIGEKAFLKIRELITVTPPKTDPAGGPAFRG
jgi:competence protein ComEA